MINLKRKGNALLNADVVKPEMRYATFDDGTVDDVKDEITLAAHFGDKLLREYGELRSNMHIVSVVGFLKTAEVIWATWSSERFAAKRKAK